MCTEMSSHQYPSQLFGNRWPDTLTIRPARIGCKLPDENGRNAFDHDLVSHGAGPRLMIADMAPVDKADVKALCEEPPNPTPVP
jgi:hypothetical protein